MKRFLAFLALIILTPAVFAAPNLFTPATNDQSLYFLSTIFGNVGNVLHLSSDATASTLMKYTFYYFNQTVLILGCIVILYTLIVSTVNTSQKGEMLGAKWNSVWIPLRSAIGFALLLPIGPGQTYAVVQAMMMWVIVQGVGAADYLWSNMVTQIEQGAGISADTASSATAADTIMGAFQYYVCAMEFTQMQGYKNYNKLGSGNTPQQYDDNNAYAHTVPRIFFQTTAPNAAQPNTNFWTFGVINPSSWSMNSICGTISTPAGTTFMTASLAQYYNNQRDILSQALGLVVGAGSPTIPSPINLQNAGGGMVYKMYLPHTDQNGNQYQVQGIAPNNDGTYYSGAQAWGIYGGNWLGDDGAQSTSTSRQTGTNTVTNYQSGNTYNGWNKGLLYMMPQVDSKSKVTYQPIRLPTVSYLAELMAEYIDANSPTPNPTASAGTNTTTGTSSNQGDSTLTVWASSNTVPYIESQLALIAQAYSDATAANYAAYQNALAAEQGNPPPTSGAKADLAAAAKFNGWASAGAFYLDMARSMQATTSDLASVIPYSYASLACSTGIGISIEAYDAGMLCQDARSPGDVGGQYNNKHKDNKKGQIGTDMGNAISQSQNITMQAQGMMMNIDDLLPNQSNSDQNMQTLCEQKSGGKGYFTYDDYRENCGIVNTTGSGAFSVTNKPQFPKMVMDPLAWYKYADQMLAYNFAVAIQPLASLGQSAVMPNPIMTLRQMGIRLLNTSAKLFHVGENYMWYSGLASMFASKWSPLPGAAMSTFTWVSSMITAMIAAMMAMGAILAYYIPMVPYLVFTLAFVQWLILTIEAMTAAPLVALGILHPEGQHEVFGHGSVGIAFMATLFLRPSLMIVGYFAATVMCVVVVLVLNAGFFFAADSMITGDATTGSVFGCIVVWMMYTNAVIVSVTKSFSLIYHIPDHVTRWIGINEPSSNVEQMMSQVKEAAKQGGEQGSAAMDAKASAKSSTGSKVFSKAGKAESEASKAASKGRKT